MRIIFCKKSVFSILFLLFFFFGTISGILLLRCILVSDCSWMESYCINLQRSAPRDLPLSIWFYFLPFLAAAAISLTSYANKLLPVLIFLRGCTTAYTIGAFYALGVPLTSILLRNLFFLPVFYAACRWLCSLHPDNNL